MCTENAASALKKGLLKKRISEVTEVRGSQKNVKWGSKNRVVGLKIERRRQKKRTREAENGWKNGRSGLKRPVEGSGD